MDALEKLPARALTSFGKNETRFILAICPAARIASGVQVRPGGLIWRATQIWPARPTQDYQPSPATAARMDKGKRADLGGIVGVWRDKRQWRLIVITAIIYAGLLIPLKPFPIVPGFTELRPANFVPVLAGVLFGPAGAWGSAFGNLIADIFSSLTMGGLGTLTAGSLFGFAGNFLFAYLAWQVWALLSEKDKPVTERRQLGIFAVAALMGSIVCAAVIGLGVFLLGLKTLPDTMFMVMFISLNNFIPALVLGTIFLVLLYDKAKEAKLVYEGK